MVLIFFGVFVNTFQAKKGFPICFVVENKQIHLQSFPFSNDRSKTCRTWVWHDVSAFTWNVFFLYFFFTSHFRTENRFRLSKRSLFTLIFNTTAASDLVLLLPIFDVSVCVLFSFFFFLLDVAFLFFVFFCFCIFFYSLSLAYCCKTSLRLCSLHSLFSHWVLGIAWNLQNAQFGSLSWRPKKFFINLRIS